MTAFYLLPRVNFLIFFPFSPHSLSFSIILLKFIVNGIEKGTGSGPSKQLAKEEAARQAYFAMGWAPREC